MGEDIINMERKKIISKKELEIGTIEKKMKKRKS